MRFLRPGPGIALLVTFLVCSSTFLSLVPPSLAGSGGPDTYGYTWTDSKPPPGVSYSWIDGVTGGQDLLLSDEGCTQTRVPFLFPFRFYGVIYNDAYVCANGFLAFNTPGGYPWDAGMDAFVAAFGYDLNPEDPASGHVYAWADTASSPRRFVVTWNGVFTYPTTDRQTFQIVLIEEPSVVDGRILLQYSTLTNPPPDPLVGIDSLGSTHNLYYTLPLEDSLAIRFSPPGLPPPGDTLTVRGTSLAPLTVEPGQKDVPFLRLNVSTPTNSINLRRVRVDVTGITSLPGDVSRISLWRDVDGDGQLNKLSDSLLIAGTPSGSPESAGLILPTALAIPAGPGKTLFVSFDVSLNAVPGDFVGAGVLTASYVTVDAPDNVSAAYFPFNTYLPGVRTRIVEGVDTLRVTGWFAANPPNVTQWQTDAPMLAATLDVDKGAVTVTRVDINHLGPRPSDVYLAKLFEDTNRDLLLQPASDRLLSKAVFNGTGNLGFALSLQFLAGVPKNLIVAYDIAPDAVVGDLVGARILNPASITVQGTADRVDSANFPIETAPPSTVIVGSPPVIDSRWAVIPPTPDGQIAAGEYVLSSGNSMDLARLGGNSVAALLTVENDVDYLYIVYDAVGDVSAGANDTASIAFRTNRTAFPLAPADDEFGTGGPMGPFHAVWNDTTAMWQIEDACSAVFDANHTGLACAIGFDRTPLSSTIHRIYEFRIPLRLLEVPAAIPAGYEIGFAAGSNWSRGIEDRDRLANSSWPLANASAPPTWYGTLRFARAPPVNTPPRLNWTGEPGFVGDGVSPDVGTTLSTFEFRVQYVDDGGDFPALGDPSLYVLAGATEIPGSPFSMTETVPADRDVTDGKVYSAVLSFSTCPQTFSYFFTAWDDTGTNATPTPELAGPVVDCPPSAPALSNGSVAPVQGFADLTNFTWSVEYRDADADPPARIELAILKGGAPLLVLPMSLLGWIGSPNNYAQGARFSLTRNLSAPGGDYSFSFLANDTRLETTTAPLGGPNVIAQPSDLLLFDFSDDAPIIGDAGQLNVKMFSAVLQANANSVSFTRLRVDRVGSSSDADVDRVKLYRDVDGDGFPSGPDVLLGQGPFSGGQVVFSGFRIDVAAGSPVQILGVIDIASSATADVVVRLRILGAGYLQVLSPDLVAPFPTATASLLVNRAPTATGLTAQGATDATPAVLHLTNPLPRLEWTFFDQNINDGVQDDANVSLVPVAGGVPWWSPALGSTTFVVYDGPPLADGVTYRMEVRVFDGRIWGPPALLVLRMNTPPPAPALTGPPNNAINQGPDSVTLQWSPVVDAEADSASYRWTLATRADFLGAATGTTPSGATSAIVQTAGATKYYWRLEAFDGYEWGLPSGTWSFTTHATSGRVFGKVVHAGAGLLAAVQLYDGSGTVVQQTTTSANGDGTFVLSGIPFGTYQVRFTSQGYEARTISAVAVDQVNPAVDLGEIELIPGVSGGLDLLQILLYGLVIASIVAAIVVVAVLAMRRRRRAPRADAQAVPGPGPAPQAATPATSEVVPEPYAFECPECGTGVDKDAKSCPGCGAIFE